MKRALTALLFVSGTAHASYLNCSTQDLLTKDPARTICKSFEQSAKLVIPSFPEAGILTAISDSKSVTIGVFAAAQISSLTATSFPERATLVLTLPNHMLQIDCWKEELSRCEN